MKLVFQRVRRAAVTADGEPTGAIGAGAMVLLGVEEGDTAKDAVYLAEKTAVLRVFEDENGKMNRSVTDIGGAVLAVSNFTLCGDCRHGRRPEFTRAARPEAAEPLYEAYVAHLRGLGVPTETGRFGADMQIDMIADGPVTLLLNT